MILLIFDERLNHFYHPLQTGGIGDIPGYPDVNFVLMLENENTKPTSTVELPLAKTHQPALTKRLFDGKYMTIYDKANFTTYKFEGIDISNIKQGTYKLSVEIKLSIGVIARTPLVSTKNLPECELDRYQVFKKDGIFYLKIA